MHEPEANWQVFGVQDSVGWSYSAQKQYHLVQEKIEQEFLVQHGLLLVAVKKPSGVQSKSSVQMPSGKTNKHTKPSGKHFNLNR